MGATLEPYVKNKPGSPLGVQRLLFQARKLIAKYWLRPQPPSGSEFLNRMAEILCMEKKKCIH